MKVDHRSGSGFGSGGGFWTLHHFTLHFLTRSLTFGGENLLCGEDPVNHDFALIKGENIGAAFDFDWTEIDLGPARTEEEEATMKGRR